MSAARGRRLLIAAFAISLLLHLLLAGYVRWPFGHPSTQPETMQVRELTIARVVPHTPRPAPVPTPRARPARKPRAKVVPPATRSRGATGPHVRRAAVPVGGPAPAPPATAAPAPVATAVAQACMQHDISPAVASTPDPAQIPPEARASKASGTAAIHVEIDPQGRITGASVAQSSGNEGLDGVAMEMAKAATYTPALVKCKPVASVYTFTVKFVAW